MTLQTQGARDRGQQIDKEAVGKSPRPAGGRSREHRRRRMRRHGRRAYIRSVYFLPSIATLGNAVCGFGAMYVAALAASAAVTAEPIIQHDRWTQWWADHGFVAAAYLIFLAMVFDALDGRLARFARHTTDFGGQLDSLADVVSFGAAPAFIAMQLFKAEVPTIPVVLSRAVWAIGALYFCCAAVRLARFNVSNEHGEQHHFSFLGLPSPGAGGAVAAWILMQQDLRHLDYTWLAKLASWVVPFLVLATGLLMVSNVRYPHVINRYLRGKRSVGRLLFVVVLVLLLVVWHQYTLAFGTFLYAFYGPATWAIGRLRRVHAPVRDEKPALPV
jgi:CDP-diacylglycerol--serine O-phosphatidyltransferase